MKIKVKPADEWTDIDVSARGPDTISMQRKSVVGFKTADDMSSFIGNKVYCQYDDAGSMIVGVLLSQHGVYRVDSKVKQE